MKTICSIAMVAVLVVAWGLGLRVNTTSSMPRGLYLLQDGELTRGDFAWYCLPEDAAPLGLRYLRASWLCPSGVQPLVKQVAALPGDFVSTDSGAVRINGSLWPDSAVRGTDSRGRPLFSSLESIFVPAGQVLLLGKHPDSFDGRYFGLAPLASCHKTIPLFTF